MSSEASMSPGQAFESHPQIRLACQACQRKKIKCDRNFPCRQCLRSSLHCVPSQRKQRARQVGKRAVDSELRTRITKLEGLVESLRGDADVLAEVDTLDSQGSPDQHGASHNLGKYVGSSFWVNLTQEVQSLREDLEEEEFDEDERAISPPVPTASGVHEYDVLVCPPSSIYVMPGALEEPPMPVAHQLYEIYFRNVDPVMKIFHRPTLRKFLFRETHYLGQDSASPPNKALRAVIWFSAITTLTDDDECVARFGAPRVDILNRYRRHVDVMFALADLMNASELATLQALTLYITAARRFDSSRRTWTMMAVIVRIARATGLHIENAIDSASPFRKELKRRLWHQIRVMDVFFAADRGTVVLIGSDSWHTPMPHNVNDSEFDESSTFIPDHETGITDMAFSRMAQTATTLSIRLLTPDFTNKQETWQQRLDAARSMGKEVRERYLQYCDHTQTFHRFIYAVGNSMIASSVLRAVRPIQRHLSSVLPRVDTPFVLELAMNCLRESEAIYQDAEAQGWRWVYWVQWHGLAVTLAGLCSIRDTELANTAWMYVDQCYERHARNIADNANGLLWRPVMKLYKKARAFRESAASPTYSSPSSPVNPSLPAGVVARGHLQGAGMPNIHVQLPPGAMPTSGVWNAPMDLPVGDGFNDMTWLDLENLMEEIAKQNAGGELPLSEMQAFPDLNGDWTNHLRQDLT